MILFSCWEQSQMKKSFMSIGSWPRNGDAASRVSTIGLFRSVELTPRPFKANQPQLEYAQLLLLFQVLGAGFLGGRLDWLGLLCAGSCVNVAGLDVDEGLFPQLGQVCSEGGLKFLHV